MTAMRKLKGKARKARKSIINYYSGLIEVEQMLLSDDPTTLLLLTGCGPVSGKDGIIGNCREYV